MKKLARLCFLCFVLLPFANSGYAQQSSSSSIVAGHFEIDTTIGSETHHINVNYALSPAPFLTTMNVQLNTADSILFNVDVADAAGAIIATWTPSAISNSYSHDFDISSWSSGDYAVKVRKYSTSTVLNTISISKP